MDNKNNKKRYTVIFVILLVLAIGITFAYLTVRSNKNAYKDANLSTGKLDNLQFNVSKDISLSINQDNFASGSGNLSDSAIASAKLRANSTKNTASYNYYVYFDITSNNYVYTTSDKKPEIVLSITDPNGTDVTSINGLSYVTATNADGTTVKGFDITTAKGLKNIAANYDITSNSSTNYTTHNWTFKVTFINLDSNQLENQKKSLKANVIIQQDEKELTLADLCIDQTLSNCVKIQYTGIQGSKNLYLHDSTLTNGAGDGSYRYAGSSDTTNNFVCFGYDSTDGTCPTDNLYRIIGVFNDQVKLIKYDYAKTSLIGTNGEYSTTYYNCENDENTSYCSGTNKASNSTTQIGVYHYNSTNTNSWYESKLNSINLNTNYLDNIGSTWANKIATHAWKIGGNTYENISQVTASVVYQNEITSPAENTTYNAKIGLMYVSDYGYAASSSAWTKKLGIWGYSDSTVTSVNWMYTGLYEWTLTPQYVTESTANTDYMANVLDSGGGITQGVVYSKILGGLAAVRPVFYLNTNVNYLSGIGTKSSPIILE